MLRVKYPLIILICLLSAYKNQLNAKRAHESDDEPPPTTEIPKSESKEYTSQPPGEFTPQAKGENDNITGKTTDSENQTTPESESDESGTSTTTRRTRTRDIDFSEEQKSRSGEWWYLKFRDRHNLPEPFQLPGRKRLAELENMEYCKCPRVYWPVCAQNGLTYLNYCIMDCLDQDLRRYGPCINYRRSGQKAPGFLSDIG